MEKERKKEKIGHFTNYIHSFEKDFYFHFSFQNVCFVFAKIFFRVLRTWSVCDITLNAEKENGRG